MTYEAWTSKAVENRILEAAETELALPRPKGPKMFGNSMPTPALQRQDAYGYHRPNVKRVPTPGALSRYEEVLDWLLQFLGPIDRGFLWWWAMAKSNPDRSIAAYAAENRMNNRTLRRQITELCQSIANDLNRLYYVRLTMPIDPVSENQAEEASETSSSVTYANHWRAPDAKPRHLPERLEPLHRAPVKVRAG